MWGRAVGKASDGGCFTSLVGSSIDTENSLVLWITEWAENYLLHFQKKTAKLQKQEKDRLQN